jgi:hypothetical protein
MQNNVAKKRKIQAFLGEDAISQKPMEEKEPRVGCQRNKACKELPLRRKQQKRSGGAAAEQERPNERRERMEKEETR